MPTEYHYLLPNAAGFKGQLLDDYLAVGYYRMMHMVFTTNFTKITMDGEAQPVFWLRTPVQEIVPGKKATDIKKQCAGFTANIKPASINEETEALYSLYYNHINFETGATCYSCLHDPALPNPFDSMMIEVRDGNTLIAAGYFDKGKKAIAGILNFYHPAYKKYSLGKFLMLQKIEYALANNMHWYYTGYIGSSFTKFDYKLFPDVEAIQVLLPLHREWVGYLKVGKVGLQEYWDGL